MANKENDYEAVIKLDDVRDFLQKNNGKVKQSDLVNNFRPQLSHQNTKVRARQDFKDILQLITAVKVENGEKYIILVKQGPEHLQTSVINRKLARPLSVRKDVAKSKAEFYFQGFGNIPEEDDGMRVSPYGSMSALPTNDSCATLDSGIGSDTQSIASSHQGLADKIKPSKSLDSIDTELGDDYADEHLEDEIGLNDVLELGPQEKEWMLAAARGNIDKMKRLLKQDSSLARQRDFVLGYTALHWGAKLGRPDIVQLVADAGVDVHSKSHGGYTPLHLAAMGGKDNVIVQLIDKYGANINARDYGGKKPRDIVKETVAGDVQRKLGRSLILEPNLTVNASGLIQRSGSCGAINLESLSPHSTPEQTRRFSRGTVANRSMSFLKKRKKSDGRHAPPNIEVSQPLLLSERSKTMSSLDRPRLPTSPRREQLRPQLIVHPHSRDPSPRPTPSFEI